MLAMPRLFRPLRRKALPLAITKETDGRYSSAFTRAFAALSTGDIIIYYHMPDICLFVPRYPTL